MGTQAWTFTLVGLSFALYIGIAIASRASSTRDFYVAGKGVSPAANGMATAADWMSAASFISMAGLISFLGYDGSVYLMGWTGGYVLLALLLAPYLRKFVWMEREEKESVVVRKCTSAHQQSLVAALTHNIDLLSTTCHSFKLTMFFLVNL